QNAPSADGACVPLKQGVRDQTKIALRMLKNTIASTAPAGRVMIHDMKIEPTTPRFSAPIPRAIPIPSTAPTRVWVVETGRPIAEAPTTVEAVASSAAKPRLGVSSVISLPMVAITL